MKVFIGVFEKGNLIFRISNERPVFNNHIFVLGFLCGLYEKELAPILQHGHYVAWDYKS